MTSASTWLNALTRLPRRAFQSRQGERVPIVRHSTLTPRRPWQRPEQHVIDHGRQVEFTFQVPDAVAESTRLAWDEESHTLLVHALADNREHAWYAEVRMANDLDGSRAEAFLKEGTLRVFAPRIDSMPLTGLPLLAWTQAYSDSSFVAAT